MRALRIFPSLVMAALLVSCDGQPLEPVPDEALTPALKVDREEDIEEISIEGLSEYVECLDEVVTFHGSWYFITWTIDTPSGNEIFHFQTGYDTPTPLWFEGTAVWTLVSGESYGGAVTKPKGTAFIYHYQGNEHYSNQDGDRIRVYWKGRVMIDADGNVKMVRDLFDYSCN